MEQSTIWKLNYTDNSPSPPVGPMDEPFESEDKALERAYELMHRLSHKVVHYIERPDGTRILLDAVEQLCRERARRSSVPP